MSTAIFDPLSMMIDRMVAEQFMSFSHAATLVVERSPSRMLMRLTES